MASMRALITGTSGSSVPAMTSATLAGLLRQFGTYGIGAGGVNRWLVPDVNAFQQALGIPAA